MVTIEISFPAGRYHATPWGAHVNEGAVEWPPSPWRLLRALLAAGFATQQWPEVPPLVCGLIDRLSGCLPAYRLPRSEAAHTRHYMPVIASGGENRTKVFDAFVRLDANDPLLVSFDVQLPEAERDALADLLHALNYLGRAESWCEAKLRDEDPVTDGRWCRPCVSDELGELGDDQIALLTPIATADYVAWRASAAAAAIAAAEERRNRKLTPGQRRKTLDAFPEDLLACLLTDTAALQQHGWSQPPGTRRVLYRRPAASVPGAPQPLVVTGHRHAASSARVDTVLLALASNTAAGQVLPLWTRVLPEAEMLHRTICGLIHNEGDANHADTVAAIEAITGCDVNRQPLRRKHGHLHILPLNLACRDKKRIDHFLLHAPGGLNDLAQRMLLRVRQTWMKGMSRSNGNGHDAAIVINCTGMGNLTDLRSDLSTRPGHPASAFGCGKVWRSLTPYVCPKHHSRGSGRNRLEEIVRAELAGRGLLDGNEVQIETWSRKQVGDVRFFQFIRRRRDDKPQPPSSVPFGFTLKFQKNVSGPIAIGYGSHFGMGLFQLGEYHDG